jgi:glycerol-3-phosphate O-acyltransferase
MITALEIAAVVLVLGFVLFLIGKRHARKLQRSRRIRIDKFKLKRRHAEIELEVFGSREVVHAIRAYAKEHHVGIDEATARAKRYLHEIVPKFNLLAYYRIGAPIARAIMHFLYRPVVDRTPIRAFAESAPKNAVVVYLINHRSNADYVLVAHMLFRFISLSYAVGEWARVWPLNHVFKWFGAYFVRRRYREPLYHTVLSKFVQTITKNGVTQGVFLEGGLTRDGAFQKPKLGMLDYIVTAKRDPEFDAPLYLIPTAINYDRVLEDRSLTDELKGKDDRSSRGAKLFTTSEFLFKNVLRSMFRRFKRYGYAIVTFGTPVNVDDFIASHPEVLADSFEARKQALQELAERVMTEISSAIPMTPVTVAARLFANANGTPLTEDAIVTAIDAWRLATPEHRWLLREKSGTEIWNLARAVLELRDLVEETPEGWRWTPGEELLRTYYANALLSFDDVKRLNQS